MADEEVVDEMMRAANGGLTSRRRMRDSYQILAQNDEDRRAGNRDTFITVGGGMAFPVRTVGLSFSTWVAMLEQAERGARTGPGDGGYHI